MTSVFRWNIDLSVGVSLYFMFLAPPLLPATISSGLCTDWDPVHTLDEAHAILRYRRVSTMVVYEKFSLEA